MKLFSIDRYDGDRKWAFIISIGDRQLVFAIPYEGDYDGIGITTNNANKFVNSEKVITAYTPFFFIEYVHNNYNKVVHILVDEKYHTNQNVDSFITTLKLWTRLDIKSQMPPFSFNYEIDENGKYKFYLTLPKGWLVEHNLGIFEMYVYPDCYMSKNEIKRLFPKYNNHKYSIHKIKKDEID